jgi:hypothetical protein
VTLVYRRSEAEMPAYPHEVEEARAAGVRFQWLTVPVRIVGEGRVEAVEPYKHFVRESTGQIPSTFDWTFVPQNGSTNVVLKAKSELPKPLLGKLSERFILKLNEREADTFFANLKDRIEA